MSRVSFQGSADYKATPTTNLLPYTLLSGITGPLELIIRQRHRVQPCLVFPTSDPWPFSRWASLQTPQTPHQCSTSNVTEGNGKSNTEQISLCFQMLAGCLPANPPKDVNCLRRPSRGKVLTQAYSSCKFLAIHLPSLCLSLRVCKIGIISSVSKRLCEDSMN